MSLGSQISAEQRPQLQALAQGWWLVLLRGLVSIMFGILAFAWPGKTLVVVILIFGAFMLVDGILALVSAFTGRARPGRSGPTWWLILVGLAGIAAGIVTFMQPGLTALVMMVFIGAWAAVHGVFEIVGAIQMRKEAGIQWMLVLSGVLSLVFGLILLTLPGPGVLGLVWAIAAYAVVFGVTLVVFSFQLRKFKA